uniref:Xaa-Pro aminopeptidase n=1 Tax=Kwoniella dejecticola CBS 10117 TaxID=1296121 RepID=A0A1A6AEX0_9TREE|nr:xaa-Pro aminopeptidase [Kwoniella dejecticola CBS 10117]OBR88573.1 xaa-Pro aminopeptidase [Kwoniella dejecticola CBS 10117]
MARLTRLRELMKDRNIDAYVVPSEDAHASEYLAPCDARRAYITSFTGSAGCAVITKDEARCWTDGRYWIQAEKQLGEGWTLMKSGLPETPTWGAWLKDLPSSSRVGIDPTTIPQAESTSLCTSLAASPTNSLLVPITENLTDIIWQGEGSQPSRPSNEIFQLADRYTGENVGSKISRLRDKLRKIGSPGMVVSSLDEIAWLFNLRGSDIPYNPVFFAYAILTRDDCTLFAAPNSLTDSVRQYLHKNGIALLDYNQIWNSLGSWQKRLIIERSQPQATDKVLIGSKTSWAIAKAVGEDNVEVRRSIIEEFKAKKNATEIEGFRQSHIRDGVALARYFAWLEQVLRNDEEWTEYDAATKLEEYRKENQWFMGLSFETISSTGPNAAIIHYAPPKEGSAVIDKNKMYLCDSGAQYLDGTTDVTRTFHFGQPTEEEKRAFTRVLQGHIALDTAVFPQGTTGYILDILARKALWQDGLDYRHSTSHGLGSFLNVHEGPQGVGQRPAYNEVALVEGMVISNEPGYYAEGKFGIRIEGVDIIVRAETRENFGGKGWLGMERITMCPIQTSLVEHSLLAPAEKEWLNDYHAEVLDKIGPLLKDDERALRWLQKECRPI